MNLKSKTTKLRPLQPSTHIIIRKLIFTLTLFKMIVHTAYGSGVFELEIVKFQDLLASRNPARLASTTQETSLRSRRAYHEPISILVCLKEPFASQLDGPCTFGNATINLHDQDSSNDEIGDRPATSKNQTISPALAIAKQAQSSHNQGSLSTNLVRIQFTFRWTKSFTIILSAEQTVDSHKSAPVGVDSERSSLNGSRSRNSAGDLQLRSQLIDRHVLTETEILPHLELSASKPWSSRFSRSLKSSLAYRFRVYCSLNHYGDGCNTFCRARDDQFGHYTCSARGQKVCLEGWQGQECDKARCRAGCNLQHGHCERPETCQCRPGWTGARCDQCLTYPGCQNGYCLGAWQCICHPNWGGQLCDQDLNYCGNHEPCRNNATCQNVAPGRYRCICQDGFSGPNCELSVSQLGNSNTNNITADCAQNPCLNGATQFDYSFNTLSTSLDPVEPVTTGSLALHQPESCVLIASVVGVLLVSLLLAWFCLLVLEKTRFPFIQMNIISAEDGSPHMSTTFRRMHDCIRNSFRRTGRIKPETKLSISNVLRPPPSYEESGTSGPDVSQCGVISDTYQKINLSIFLSHANGLT